MDYIPLPETRTDLGYSWTEQSIDKTLALFAGHLRRNNAKAYIMDVYASNDQVYQNIVIQLPAEGIFPAENIHIQFNRDEGRQLSFSRTEE